MTKRPIRVIIVDDEPLARSRLRRILLECDAQVPNVMLGEFGSSEALLESQALRSVDLLLLDIEMPGLNGLDSVGRLRRARSNLAVVFTTAHSEFAVQAFDIAATDYLLKPVRLERLLEALLRVQAQISQSADPVDESGHSEPAVMVSDLGQVLKIPVKNILFFRAEHKFVTVRTPDHAYLLSDSLLDLEQRFGELLLRIHRSCLVVRQNLIGFEWRQKGGLGRWFAVLTDWPEQFPVSRRQAWVVKQFRKGL